MTITIKNGAEIEGMRIAGRIAAETLDFITPFIQAEVSTGEINDRCHEYILSRGCISATLGYRGFPKSVCTSVNDVVCHGIPSYEVILREGDIINVDVTVIKEGFFGDTSRMYFIGKCSEKAVHLVERTKKAMMRGIEAVKPHVHLNEIGKAIEEYIEKFSYGIVREYTGHGIGRHFHEDPHVFHYDTRNSGPRLEPGMIFTIEPMINMSPEWETFVDKEDKWTVRTKDGALSAQWEHTILVTETGYEILTLSPQEGK